jgi:RNA polymerase sigma-70 factor, ECF subfamily
MVSTHFDFVWRSLRRSGLPPHAADDAAQQVFLVASRRIADIRQGAERAFLFNTALRVGADAKRSFASKSERLDDTGDLAQVQDSAPSPEERADRSRALHLLDAVLAELPEELRTVLTLFEIEELEAKEIAEILSIPTGTVASRLRRAREEFQNAVKRLRAREQFQERLR